MLLVREGDTICAIATPPGEGGLHVIRVSGPRAIEMVDACFRPARGRALRERKGFTLGAGMIVEQEEEIDEVVTALYRKPRSYTGEDIVEVSCHGSQVVARRLLELFVRRGARLAEPGEFTKRAFLAGRIDLVQAEAVADLISAKTQESAACALGQLRGRLSGALARLKEDLVGLIAHVEAYVDFPEEDLEVFTSGELAGKLEAISDRVGELLGTYARGALRREGATAAIVGKPNVGKSSLLNALAERDRVLVSEIPGTTRDVITEWVSLGGLPVRLMDTAGLRRPGDRLEALGIEKAREAMQEATVFLWVIDGSQPVSSEDFLARDATRGKPTVLVFNKCDLPVAACPQPGFSDGACAEVKVSAKTGEGIEALETLVLKILLEETVAREEIGVTRLRHQDALGRVADALAAGARGFEKKLSLEFIASDLRDARSALGELVGEIYTDDILDRIFSEFCVGK